MRCWAVKLAETLLLICYIASYSLSLRTANIDHYYYYDAMQRGFRREEDENLNHSLSVPAMHPNVVFISELSSPSQSHDVQKYE